MEGMKLKNETEFAEVKNHWLKTYNIAYPVIMAMPFRRHVRAVRGIPDSG